MSEISGIEAVHPGLEHLSINKSTDVDQNAKDKMDFLTLMIAQLENQNPLEPQESGDFLSQLAQFNTVEGVNNLNTSMSSMADSYRSSQTLQATSLVGRSVQIPTGTAELESIDGLQGSIELPFTTTNNITVDIFKKGELIKSLSLDGQKAGDVSFDWHGDDEDGVAQELGTYTFEARAVYDGETIQLKTLVNVNVDSVTVAQTGGVRLNLADGRSVTLDEVKQIN